MSECGWTEIVFDLSEEIPLEKNIKHNIEIIVDRLVIRPDITQRLTDSCEIASKLSGGIVVINLVREDKDLLFSQNYACEDCGISIEELSPRSFSFNNPYGACPTCAGLGQSDEGRSGSCHSQQGAVHSGRRHLRQRVEQHPWGRHQPDVL